MKIPHGRCQHLYSLHTALQILSLFWLLNSMSSCSSFHYTEQERAMHNTVIIKTNVDNPKIQFAYQKDATVVQNEGGIKITFNSLKKASMKLIISQDNYAPKLLKIKRTPRKKALVRDLVMLPFTLGLSTIDLFRADFYRVANRSQRNYIELDFTTAYMDTEFNRVKGLNDVTELRRYISTFPKSFHRDEAFNLLRRLEFQIAVDSKNEIKVKDFITAYPNSDEAFEAKVMLENLQSTRLAFDSASATNTLESYETFMKDYPGSVHHITACRRLVEVGVRQVLLMNELVAAENLMSRSILKYGNEIGFSVYQNKLDSIAQHFSSQIFDAINTASEGNRYELAKKAWKRYLEVAAIFSQVKESSYVADLRQFIYNELFIQLQQQDNAEKQRFFAQEVLIDYPNFFIQPVDLRIEIIDACNLKTGTLHCYDFSYWAHFIRFEDVLSPGISDTLLNYSNSIHSSLDYCMKSNSHEELQFNMNTLHGLQRAFIGDQVCHEANYSLGFAEGVERVWIGGDLAMEKQIQQGNEWYRFEFRNGENITLRPNEADYQAGIRATDKLDFETAFYYFENARDNELPYFHPFNEKVEDAKEQLERKKKEEERRQAEIKHAEEEQKKLAELKAKSKQRRVCVCGIPFSHEGRDIQPDCKTTIRGGEFHSIDCALQIRCPKH